MNKKLIQKWKKLCENDMIHSTNHYEEITDDDTIAIQKMISGGRSLTEDYDSLETVETCSDEIKTKLSDLAKFVTSPKIIRNFIDAVKWTVISHHEIEEELTEGYNTVRNLIEKESSFRNFFNDGDRSSSPSKGNFYFRYRNSHAGIVLNFAIPCDEIDEDLSEMKEHFIRELKHAFRPNWVVEDFDVFINKSLVKRIIFKGIVRPDPKKYARDTYDMEQLLGLK